MSRYLVLAVSTLLLCADAPARAQQSLPRSHPKYKTARKVFDDLVRAIGDGRTSPELRLQPNNVSSSMQVAWFTPKKNTLALEERVYDLCVALGPDSLNALATLLGHELAHYYKDHGWVGDFGNGFADLPVGQRLKALRRQESKMIEIETEADYFGGFFGHVAGYNTLEVTPHLLQEIYLEYGLDDDMPGYPSLPERQEIARRSAAQVQQLIPVFEAGKNLLLLAKYEEGARCFDYIARTFPSREILNNAGVARALEAIDLLDAGQRSFAYPFELDAETRLRHAGKTQRSGFGENRRAQRERLLKEAVESFENARKKDPDYATAYVNLACATDLQGDFDSAAFYAAKAIEIAGKNGETDSRAHALIARGIVTAHANLRNEDAARKDFVDAKAGNPTLALLNLAVLEGADVAGATAGGREKKSGPIEESVGAASRVYERIISAPDARAELPQSAETQPAMLIFARELGDRDGLVIDTGHSEITLVETGSNYDGLSARGIKIGSDLEQVHHAYGHPTRLVSSRQGAFHLYEHAQIVFQTSAADRVRGWMHYDIEEDFYDVPDDRETDEMQTEQRVALVIGNGAYGDVPLKNPVNDAQAVAQALEYCGFEVSRKINADRKEMRQAIRDFGNQLKKGGVGLFYYAGHGLQVDGLNYLAPVGVDVAHEDEVEDECILVSSVMRKMESASNRVNIVILDACRNNPFARSFRSQGRGLAGMDAATGSLVAYATAPGRVAADGDGTNGLYTSRLLKYLQVPGLSIEQVFKNVRRDVKTASAEKQVPWESSSLTGDFYFVLPPTEGRENAGAGHGYAASSPPPAVIFGHLQVNASVPESRVYIDGTLRGNAGPGDPLNLENLAVGEIEVRVEALGYQSATQEHSLTAGQWTQAVFSLPPVLPSATSSQPSVSGPDSAPESIARRTASPHEEMVYVSDFAFYIDTYEVTNAAFAAFLNARGNQIEGEVTWLDMSDPDARIERRGGRYLPVPGHEDHPVVEVSWFGAQR